MQRMWPREASGPGEWRLSEGDLLKAHRRRMGSTQIFTYPVHRDLFIHCKGTEPQHHPYASVAPMTADRLTTLEYCANTRRRRGRATPSRSWAQGEDQWGYMLEGYFNDRLHCSRYAASEERANFYHVGISLVAVRKFIRQRPRSTAERPGPMWLYANMAFRRLWERSAALRRTQGGRFMWVISHDQGKWYNRFLPGELRRHVAILTPTANVRPDRFHQDTDGLFRPSQDVALPPHGYPSAAAAALRRLPPGRIAAASTATRACLAFFAGQVVFPLRSHMVEAFRKEPLCTGLIDGWRGEGKCSRVLGTHVGREEYVDSLAGCDFCLMPRGSAVWSPRLVGTLAHFAP